MEKIVQIITIPLDKDGWDKGDLVKQNSSNISFTIARYNNDIKDNSVYTPQQLLVFSDDEIQGNDWFYSIETNTIFEPLNMHRKINFGPNFRKIIASYPQLEGTLPLSKETIQQWIDNGTPEEGSIELVRKIPKGCSILTCSDLRNNTCDCGKEKWEKTDSQGNLILEFDKKQTYEEMLKEKFVKMASSALGTTDVSPEFRDWVFKAPIIPTYEKINNMASDYAVEKCRIMKNMKCLTARKTAYIDGYKQALKDLGYDN
jgi:hypothetical protein